MRPEVDRTWVPACPQPSLGRWLGRRAECSCPQNRHPGAGRDPVSHRFQRLMRPEVDRTWVPACAGTTCGMQPPSKPSSRRKPGSIAAWPGASDEASGRSNMGPGLRRDDVIEERPPHALACKPGRFGRRNACVAKPLPHPGAGRDPSSHGPQRLMRPTDDRTWVPACAGTTCGMQLPSKPSPRRKPGSSVFEVLRLHECDPAS